MKMDRIPAQARHLRGGAALFVGADAGFYTLPPELVAAGDGIVRLAEELHEAEPVDVTQAEAAYLRRMIDAATAGTDLPDTAPIQAVEEVTAVFNRRSALLARGIDQADGELDRLMRDLSDRIIRQHLAPAVDEVMTGVVKAAEALPADSSAESVLRSGDKARRAWLGLGDLGSRYAAIRRGASVLRSKTPAEWDQRGDFSELHNYHEVTAGMNIQPGGPRPWPTATGDRLLWYVRHGGRVWLPTVAEQDTRYHEINRDKLAAAKRGRTQLTATRHAFS